MRDSIQIQTIKRFLFSAIGLLILFHVMGQFSAHILDRRRLLGFVGMFRLQSEHNAPAYFSGFLLATAGVLLLLIARHSRLESSRKALPWFALGVMFFYLAIDEVITIHEHFGALGSSMSIFDGLMYKWVVVGALLVLAVVGLFFRFWLNLPPKTRLWFALAAVVFVGGAIGFETISGLYAKHNAEDFVFSLLIVLEEGMEMAGVALFITALVRYIQPRFNPLGLQLLDGPTATDAPEPHKPEPVRPAAATKPVASDVSHV